MARPFALLASLQPAVRADPSAASLTHLQKILRIISCSFVLVNAWTAVVSRLLAFNDPT